MKGETVSENVVLRGIDTIVTREGEKLECWDLHIGMKLNLLGRKMTLMQADLVTVNWLDQQAIKLRKMKVSRYVYRQKINIVHYHFLQISI